MVTGFASTSLRFNTPAPVALRAFQPFVAITRFMLGGVPDELAAMDRNQGRFVIQHDNTTDLSAWSTLPKPPPRPLSDWIEHTAAVALRDEYFHGRRTP